MKIEVITPAQYLGVVSSDLSKRRGILQGTEDSTMGKIIHAQVPLAEMFGYATDLRSATQGRATYTMEFEKYDVVPAHIASTMISQYC
jgi:elongation factor G